jgi:hypothetical protein
MMVIQLAFPHLLSRLVPLANRMLASRAFYYSPSCCGTLPYPKDLDPGRDFDVPALEAHSRMKGNMNQEQNFGGNSPSAVLGLPYYRQQLRHSNPLNRVSVQMPHQLASQAHWRLVFRWRSG